jgi:hypothetical protein
MGVMGVGCRRYYVIESPPRGETNSAGEKEFFFVKKLPGVFSGWIER